MSQTTGGQITLQDAQAIKALSHPARLAVIDELYGGRVATATELSEVTGLSPNATGWHLRALQKLGVVERDDTVTDRREHPWRAAGTGITVSPSLPTRAQQAAASLLSGAVIDALHRDLDAYTAGEAGLPEQWQHKANLDAGAVYLTAEETAQLIEAVVSAVEPFRRRTRPRADARRVRIATAVIPSID
jgi:DNA-binding transcriptional ArsR family regulator